MSGHHFFTSTIKILQMQLPWWGEVHVQFEPVSGADLAVLQVRLQTVRTPVALFGGGHVGHALVQVLGNLPLRITWVDSRDEIFPSHLPEHVACEHSDPVQAAVRSLAPGSRAAGQPGSRAAGCSS